MLFKLFMKECSQTVKSLTYWLMVIIMVLFFASQMGQMDMEKAPEKGLEDYGVKPSKDKNIIMSATLGMLAGEYAEGRYTTYPIGFVKSVTLGKEEEAKVGEILKEATGLDKEEIEEIEEKIDEFYENSGGIITSGPVLEPLESLSYGRFEEIMQEVDDMLGGGSSYALDSLGDNGSEPKTYEDAVKEYEELVQKDGYTGGYARLFSDYMVIILGILPVFLAVTRELRDRRANMQEADLCPKVLFHDDHRKQVPVYGRDDIDSSLCVIYTAFGRLRHLCKNSRNIGGLPGICKVYRRMAAAHRHGGDGAWHALDGTDGYCACSAGTGSLVVRLHLYGGEDDERRKVWMESDSQA
ncbi:MAG: hypothetical protein ACLR71_10545 [[Clostridium] scindens]